MQQRKQQQTFDIRKTNLIKKKRKKNNWNQKDKFDEKKSNRYNTNKNKQIDIGLNCENNNNRKKTIYGDLKLDDPLPTEIICPNLLLILSIRETLNNTFE